MTTEDGEFDLVIRDELVIAARAAAVWHSLRRPQDWKASIVSVEHMAGPRGGEGEELLLRQRAGEQVVPMRHRTVACVEPSWWVQWLAADDGRGVRGYLVYSLAESGGTTLMVGELLLRAELPGAGGRPSDEASRIIRAATESKFHADHLQLKNLVERA